MRRREGWGIQYKHYRRVLAHPLDWFSRLDCSTTMWVSMPKRAVFERSRRELPLHVSVGVHILLVVEQSSLESQSRGYAKTPILTVYQVYSSILFICRYLFISPRGSPSITLTRRVVVAKNFRLQYFTVLRLTSDITPRALLV